MIAFVATAFRRFQNRDTSLLRPAFHPLLELLGDAAQEVPAHRVELSVHIEEADDPLRLLKWLD
jgi:hypothetical protein